jgi:thymidine kinase
MSLSIICGNMFSGKTSELIRRLKCRKAIGDKILVINSSKDTRSTERVLRTHDNVAFTCLKVYDIFDVIHMPEFDDADVVAIDEAQFFPRLKKFVECGMYVNKNIIIAGLDADSSQRKIGEIIDCIPMACDVTKLSALCMRCKNGTPGPFTKRTVDDKSPELIGGCDKYVAVCRYHLTSYGHLV